MLVDPRNARDPTYLEHLHTMEHRGTCPFCPEAYDHTRILQTRGSWHIARSNWPYESAKHHLLIISKEHRTSFLELSASDFSDIQMLFKWAMEQFCICGGGLALRFGETLYSGATVCHLHFHIIQPELKADGTSVHVVHFPIG